MRLQIGNNISKICRSLSDTGATLNCITKQFVRQNALQTTKCRKEIVGIGGFAGTLTEKITAFIIPWYESRVSTEAEFYVIDSLDGYYPPFPIEAEKEELSSVMLADKNFDVPAPVEALIGAETYTKIIGKEIYRHKEGAIMQSTQLGYIVLGKLSIRKNSIVTSSVFNISDKIETNNENIDRLLRNFWETENICENKFKQSKEHKIVEDLFLKTHRRNEIGRYVVTIPIRQKCNGLGNSSHIARRQFHQLERRLSLNEELREKYIKQMREYIQLGYMKEAPAPVDEKWSYWIPHHAVKKKKFRIVYNASSKTSTGESLNSIQLIGEKLQCDLAMQIIRFRRNKIGITTDISKMFNQVCVNPKQWDLQRIFWREAPEERLKEYHLTVVTFGLASSAHCAVRSMIQCAKDHAKSFPQATQVIEKCFYMDDGIFGAKGLQEAKLLCKEVEFVLQQGGFELKHWASNAKEVEAELNTNANDIQLIGKNDEEKILGIRWLKETDEITIFVKPIEMITNPTKRQILREILKLYDPNGLVACIVIKAKMIMQDIWRLKEAQWDDVVPSEIAKKWKDFQADLPLLGNFRIPRWLKTDSAITTQLHGFADASTKAYGITIYARVIDGVGKIHSTLIVSKSRVAPIKEVSIPRLELLAAEMLGKQMLALVEAGEFDKAKIFLWTDSLIALHWIRKSTHELKAFVANRVNNIQQDTQFFKWSHVISADNPADLVSRGMEMNKFLGSELWLHGPKWLIDPQCNWPKSRLTISPNEQEEIDKEAKTKAKSYANVFPLTHQDGQQELYRQMDSWDKVINVTGYVHRFVNNCRLKRDERPKSKYLSRNERGKAIRFWIKYAQNKAYKKEIACIKAGSNLPTKSKLAALRPIIDKEGLLRIGGRIDKANTAYENRHPHIIPPRSRLSYLIISHTHKITMHSGTQAMMRFIRETYWIPTLRSEVRQYIHKCIQCVRQSGVMVRQIMADLPPVRVRPAAPFQNVGVDMAGPFEMKITDKINLNTRARNLPDIKCWVAVFVCLVTRAVHLEATEGMSTDDFLAAYQRFVSRRGNPQAVYSDNGTNFVGAKNELNQAYEIWTNEGIQHFVHEQHTEWHFIKPNAPHEGGIWEAAVKSMKFHMKRVMGQQRYSLQSLNTLLAGIEACLNSRPLCALSDDPSDFDALTPAHFLIGRPLRLPAHEKADEPPKSAKRMIKAMQFQTQSLWNRWSQDYLHSLVQRPKWQEAQANLKAGTLVLIKNENVPPTYWSMGRVIETYEGNDGKVRSAKVKTHSGELERSVRRLCVLPTDEDLDYWVEK